MRMGLGLGIPAPAIIRAGNAGTSYDADALAFFTRAEAVGATLTTPYKDATAEHFFDSLKSSGAWNNLTRLYNFAQPAGSPTSYAVCLLNMRQDAFNGTLLTGTINFTANGSIDFGSNADGIDFGLMEQGQNDAHYGIVVGTVPYVSTRTLFADAGPQVRLQTQGTDTGLYNVRLNSNTNAVTATVRAIGTLSHVVLCRDNSANLTFSNAGEARETLSNTSAAPSATNAIAVPDPGANSIGHDTMPYRGFHTGTGVGFTEAREQSVVDAFVNFRADMSSV